MDAIADACILMDSAYDAVCTYMYGVYKVDKHNRGQHKVGEMMSNSVLTVRTRVTLLPRSGVDLITSCSDLGWCGRAERRRAHGAMRSERQFG